MRLLISSLSKTHPSTMPILTSTPFWVKYCEEAIANHRVGSGDWRLSVENAIAPLLPHGRAGMAEVAQRLGVTKRTLARRLASEGRTFGEVLDGLRFDLATHYLHEKKLPISEVAWLLGYASAFDHAFKRWTGKTPSQTRSSNGTSTVRIAA
jgi:AraC-like DNA-binding protein